jgi:SAM-dependent methyltransferase
MSAERSSLPPAYFESLYAGDPDPWRFASSPYEREKYRRTLAALPRARYRRGFEVGCSIGVLTAEVARRCDELLAVDVAEEALAAARQRCAAMPSVRLVRMQVPDELPSDSFDLVILSEFLYYLSASDIDRTAAFLDEALAPGGDVILVHWTGPTDYPLSADRAVELVSAATHGFMRLLRQERQPRYRLEVLRRSRASARRGRASSTPS